MKYEDRELGFSFELPEGWRRDDHNLTLTFYGRNGGAGITSELIQVKIGTILSGYLTPESREQFLAEPGARVLRSRVGDEDNVVVLRRVRDSEISVVRDGIQYTISHTNDPAAESAVERLKKTARFPSSQMAQSAIRRMADPKHQAVSRMLHGKAPVPALQRPTLPREKKAKGILGCVLSLFQTEPSVQTCETCSHRMQVLGFPGSGGVMLSVEELASGIGEAEQCCECGRLYCAECYPSRPPNTCVCGRGSDVVHRVGGTVYRGSLRLVKVRYIS
jgi:hypothetical protein